MGKHDGPYTGTGRRKGNGPKPERAQITQVSDSGVTLGKATAKLWGIFSSSIKRPK